MRCCACNKDMSSTNGDEYWRTIDTGAGKKRILEDLCKTCRKAINQANHTHLVGIYGREVHEELSDLYELWKPNKL